MGPRGLGLIHLTHHFSNYYPIIEYFYSMYKFLSEYFKWNMMLAHVVKIVYLGIGICAMKIFACSYKIIYSMCNSVNI